MNIHEAIVEGQKENRAVRRANWRKGMYVYHGMDNVLRWSVDDRELDYPLATLLATDWEMSDFPYHGHLEQSKNEWIEGKNRDYYDGDF